LSGPHTFFLACAIDYAGMQWRGLAVTRWSLST